MKPLPSIRPDPNVVLAIAVHNLLNGDGSLLESLINKPKESEVRDVTIVIGVRVTDSSKPTFYFVADAVPEVGAFIDNHSDTYQVDEVWFNIPNTNNKASIMLNVHTI